MKKLFLTLSLVFLSVISFSQIPVSGLVAYYPFTNGSLTNAAGAYSNINAITDTNIVSTFDMIGDTNDAYHFDGISYLSVSSSPKINMLSFDSNAYTCAGWFKIDSGSYDNAIFEFFDGMSAISLYLTNSDSLLKIQQSAAPTLSSITKIEPKTWYFYTILCKKTETYLYLNGRKDNHQTYNVQFPGSVIGYIGNISQLSDYFNGSITQFMIYNRLLDSTEISNIYYTFNPLMPNSPRIVSTMDTIDTGHSYTIDSSSLSKHMSTLNKTYYFYDTNNSIVGRGSSYTTPVFLNDTVVKYFITSFDSATMKESTPISVTINVKDITTVVREYSELSTSVYPNPTTEFVNVSLQKESIVCLYTIDGKLLEEKIGKNLRFDLSNLSSGVYLINGIKVIKN